MGASSAAPAQAPSRPWRAILATATATLFLGLMVPASANHVQNDNGSRAIAFDHVAGNEWWVEVAISGPDAFTAIGVFAHDGAGSNLHGLEKKSWGTWGGSFHIEPGHDVQFRALWANGAEQNSCWFSHPAGVENCGTTPPPPPPPGAFDASFTGFTGNQWWEQAKVAASTGYAIGTVDVRMNNGPWKPLALQSWGGWAASYQAVQGTVVQMRATATNGETDVSSCRQWIPAQGQDATIVACPTTTPPPPPPPPPGVFDATFTGVKGNDWWVQVNVAANQPVRDVVVRVNCASDWQGLTKQSWGGWTSSFNIPPGSRVDFQARNATYASDNSGSYIWPQATPTPGCAQGNWPRQGSFATYRMDSSVCGDGNCEGNWARMHLVYDQGRWLGRCFGHDEVNGIGVRDWSSDHVGLPPPWLTPFTRVGATHRPALFQAGFGEASCSQAWSGVPVVVHGVETVVVGFEGSGQQRPVDAWAAASRDETENLWVAHWDKDTGLVLDVHSEPRRSGQGQQSMVLIDTNQPLQ